MILSVTFNHNTEVGRTLHDVFFQVLDSFLLNEPRGTFDFQAECSRGVTQEPSEDRRVPRLVALPEESVTITGDRANVMNRYMFRALEAVVLGQEKICDRGNYIGYYVGSPDQKSVKASAVL